MHVLFCWINSEEKAQGDVFTSFLLSIYKYLSIIKLFKEKKWTPTLSRRHAVKHCIKRDLFIEFESFSNTNEITNYIYKKKKSQTNRHLKETDRPTWLSSPHSSCSCVQRLDWVHCLFNIKTYAISMWLSLVVMR